MTYPKVTTDPTAAPDQKGVPASPRFPGIEERILAYWAENGTFQASIGTLLPHARSGKMRGLSVTSLKRSAMAPEFPTLDESGLKGFEVLTWFGILGPANMPTDVTAKIAGDFIAALNTDSVKDRLTKLGASPIGASPRQFTEKIQADYDKWGPIIKASGIKPE